MERTPQQAAAAAEADAMPAKQSPAAPAAPADAIEAYRANRDRTLAELGKDIAQAVITGKIGLDSEVIAVGQETNRALYTRLNKVFIGGQRRIGTRDFCLKKMRDVPGYRLTCKQPRKTEAAMTEEAVKNADAIVREACVHGFALLAQGEIHPARGTTFRLNLCSTRLSSEHQRIAWNTIALHKRIVYGGYVVKCTTSEPGSKYKWLKFTRQSKLLRLMMAGQIKELSTASESEACAAAPAPYYPINGVDGREEWWVNGRPHREAGPAITAPDGTQKWYFEGKLHREHGPAVVNPNGVHEWYRHGKRHRLGGPAVKGGPQTHSKKWYYDGKLHRRYGPAIEHPDGGQEWYEDGKRHRHSGPAIELKTGCKEWYRHGKKIYRR